MQTLRPLVHCQHVRYKGADEHAQIVAYALLIRRVRERAGVAARTAFVIVEAALHAVADVGAVARVGYGRDLERVLVVVREAEVDAFRERLDGVRGERVRTEVAARLDEVRDLGQRGAREEVQGVVRKHGLEVHPRGLEQALLHACDSAHVSCLRVLRVERERTGGGVGGFFVPTQGES